MIPGLWWWYALEIGSCRLFMYSNYPILLQILTPKRSSMKSSMNQKFLEHQRTIRTAPKRLFQVLLQKHGLLLPMIWHTISSLLGITQKVHFFWFIYQTKETASSNIIDKCFQRLQNVYSYLMNCCILSPDLLTLCEAIRPLKIYCFEFHSNIYVKSTKKGKRIHLWRNYSTTLLIKTFMLSIEIWKVYILSK